MNLKGIAVYLSLSYLLVFLFVFIGHAEGALSMASPNLFQFLLLAALMGIPALCAAIARHFCPDNAPAPHPIWPVDFATAARVTLLPVAVFAIACLIATIAGPIPSGTSRACSIACPIKGPRPCRRRPRPWRPSPRWSSTP